MSRAKTEKLIKDYYAAFNRGDMERFVSLLDAKVVHEINQGGSERGLSAFRRFMARMNRCYKERLSAVRVMASADGKRAAAEFVVHGTYLATDKGLPKAKGQRYRLPGGAFFEIRRGKIARITNYYNLTEWLRQIR
ncbi:MAG: ketosteroid isomerase-related protein [Alphaproteobacteria bacterium]